MNDQVRSEARGKEAGAAGLQAEDGLDHSLMAGGGLCCLRTLEGVRLQKQKEGEGLASLSPHPQAA